MQLKLINKKIYTAEYLKDREILWEKKLSEYQKSKTPLWNGVLYYFEKLEGEMVLMGLCEYKDLIFVEGKNILEVKEKYKIDFDFTFMNVQILIKDKQNNYLFGTKHTSQGIELIAVGGTLRLEEERNIANLCDITNYAIREMEIETSIEVDPKKLHFLDMIVSENICTFLFSYVLDHVQNGLLMIGEFDGDMILSKKELFNQSGAHHHARLKSLQAYLEQK